MNIKTKIPSNIFGRYKQNFYQKSLVLRTDFSNYNRYFKIWHPRYFDVNRRTHYQKYVRDTKKLTFNTQDPLFFDNSDYENTGGFQAFLDHVKADKNEKTTYSIYNAIYLMYNMALNEIYDNKFYEEVESNINPILANSSMMCIRHFYGALFAYYKFNRGKPENQLFFENSIEEEPTAMHSEQTITLFQLAHEATILDRERLDLLIINFFKPNFLINWDKQIKYKPRLIAEVHRVFQKINYLDKEVWTKLINLTIDIKKVSNMDDYHKMLKGLLWYNDHPHSPLFQSINKEIEIFKDKIRNSDNRFWKYDPEKASWRSYEELIKTREDIDDSYIFAFLVEEDSKGDQDIVIEQKENLDLESVKNIVVEKLAKKENIVKIRDDLLEKEINPQLIENAFILIAKEKQIKAVEELKKKGEFTPDLTDEQYKEKMKKQRLANKPTPAKGGAGKKEEPDKKKKK